MPSWRQLCGAQQESNIFVDDVKWILDPFYQDLLRNELGTLTRHHKIPTLIQNEEFDVNISIHIVPNSEHPDYEGDIKKRLKTENDKTLCKSGNSSGCYVYRTNASWITVKKRWRVHTPVTSIQNRPHTAGRYIYRCTDHWGHGVKANGKSTHQSQRLSQTQRWKVGWKNLQKLIQKMYGMIKILIIRSQLQVGQIKDDQRLIMVLSTNRGIVGHQSVHTV